MERNNKKGKLIIVLVSLLLVVVILVGAFSCVLNSKTNVPDNTLSSDGSSGKTDEDIEPDNDLPPIYDTSFSGYNFEQQPLTNTQSVRFDRLVAASKAQQEMGINGNGCQWPDAMEVSADGELMLYAVDVAGMFKSTDHGENWVPANKGLVGRGTGMFAIDPKNTDHVLVMALSWDYTAIHISYDRACTWTKIDCPEVNSLGCWANRYLWDGFEFDITSYDQTKNMCSDVYLSTPFLRDTTLRYKSAEILPQHGNTKLEQAGLWLSKDYGEHFSLVINDYKLADGIVKITGSGDIFVGNQYGLFKIIKPTDDNPDYTYEEILQFHNDISYEKTGVDGDGKDVWEIKSSKVAYKSREIAEPFYVDTFHMGVTGMDNCFEQLFVQTWDGIYKLNTVGANKNSVAEKITDDQTYTPKQWPQALTVSPTNPDHIIYHYRQFVFDTVDNPWSNDTNVSFDGGKTWTKAVCDSNSFFYSKISWRGREKVYLIDPTDDNRVVAIGSDNIVISKDGGLNFVQASGITNLMQAGTFNFNYFHPEMLTFGGQDYTGMVSYDGGKTYERIVVNVIEEDQTSPDYGKLVPKANLYGAYSADKDTIFGFTGIYSGTGRLTVTHDGGKTWDYFFNETVEIKEQSPLAATYISTLQAINSPNHLFAGKYWSTDNGYTWSEMNDNCLGVYAVNWTGEHELYGGDSEGYLVVSYDDGYTWQRVSDLFRPNYAFPIQKRQIVDIAIDHVNNYAYCLIYFDYLQNGQRRGETELIKVDINQKKIVQYYTNPKGAQNPVLRDNYHIPLDRNNGWAWLSGVAVDPNNVNILYLSSLGYAYFSRSGVMRSLDGGKSWEILTDNKDGEGFDGIAENNGGYEVMDIRVYPLTGELYMAGGCFGYETMAPPYDNSKLKFDVAKDKVHTVVYIVDGKKIATDKIKNYTAIQTQVSKKGYEFDGWYLDKELTKPFTQTNHIVNSMYLYGRFVPGNTVKFYHGDDLIYEVNSDDIKAMKNLDVPKKDGYVFAGWYDKTTGEKEEFTKPNLGDKRLIAKFFKATKVTPEITIYDGYIKYDTHVLTKNNRVDDNTECENRLMYFNLEDDGEYMINMFMDNRFRIGQRLGDDKFWSGSVLDTVTIDSDDKNVPTSVLKNASLFINTANGHKIAIFYYTTSSLAEIHHKQISDSLEIYKLESKELYE